MKRVLVTAGCVYGSLDDNKIVGNRIRGIWASRFAQFLAEKDYEVTLLVPDINTPKYEPYPRLTVVQFRGYNDYAEKCYAAALSHDAAIMAAAVVNWIPAEPIKGKMKTEGFEEGAIQNIPFVLAPRVIDRMRKLNPKLTLIGCKMTSGAEKSETLKAAYYTLLKAHCNVVVANDLSGLKEKTLVYPDGHTRHFEGDFEAMYSDLESLLADEFYRTEPKVTGFVEASDADVEAARKRFDAVVEKYRARFTKRPDGANGVDRVFGSVAVLIDDWRVLVSPREKGVMFSSKDAVVVESIDRPYRVVYTQRGEKATLNAPLLCAVLGTFNASAVLHLHEENARWPTYPYAPSGSVRDNDRTFTRAVFNIAGHGFVAALDNQNEFFP